MTFSRAVRTGIAQALEFRPTRTPGPPAVEDVAVARVFGGCAAACDHSPPDAQPRIRDPTGIFEPGASNSHCAEPGRLAGQCFRLWSGSELAIASATHRSRGAPSPARSLCHGCNRPRAGGGSRRALLSARCGHLNGLRLSTAARGKRVSQTQPRGAAAPRETGGQVRPKHWRVHRCRDRPRRLGDHHANAIDRARVTTGGGDALGERRGD